MGSTSLTSRVHVVSQSSTSRTLLSQALLPAVVLLCRKDPFLRPYLGQVSSAGLSYVSAAYSTWAKVDVSPGSSVRFSADSSAGNTCDATVPGPFHRKCSRCVKGKAYCIPIEDPALIAHANNAVRAYEQLAVQERLGRDAAAARAHFDAQHGIFQGNLRMFQQHRRNRVGDVATPHRGAAGGAQSGGQAAQALALSAQRLSTGLESLVDMMHGVCSFVSLPRFVRDSSANCMLQYLLSSALERNSEHQAPLQEALARTTVRHRRWDGDVASATLEEFARGESPTAPSRTAGVRDPLHSWFGAASPRPTVDGVQTSGGLSIPEDDEDEVEVVEDGR
jgi:hypothetical protein